MYCTDAVIENYGPVEQLRLIPQFTAAGKPVPIVLVGTNGSGKTILLSTLADAIFEAIKIGFTDIGSQLPGEQGRPFLRLMSIHNITSGKNHSLCAAAFSQGTDKYFFYEKTGPRAFADFQSAYGKSFAETAGWGAENHVKKISMGAEASDLTDFLHQSDC